MGLRLITLILLTFIHSYTEDPGMNDLIYAGHIKRISIAELKRLAGDQFTEEDYEKIAKKSTRYSARSSNKGYFDSYTNKMKYEYDDYMIEVLDFEFMSVDCVYYEEKENRHGNTGFFHQGNPTRKGQVAFTKGPPQDGDCHCLRRQLHYRN